MSNDFILVLDLGGAEAVRMARKLRNQRYYTEIISRSADIGLFRRKDPRGIVITGGEGASESAFPSAVLSLGIPVLAMGGAARRLALAEGARCEGTLLTDCTAQIRFRPCPLFDGLGLSDRYLYRVDGFQLPGNYEPIATTLDGLAPAFADFERNLYALQFYAESNDPDGAAILSNFAEKICGCTPMWTTENYIDEEIRFIREKVGDQRAVIAVSGGVDSAACALLMRRAIGDRLSLALVDNGLLREGEAENVLSVYRGLGLEVRRIDARARFMERLKGLVDPARKRRAVRREFEALLQEVAQDECEGAFLVMGTIYSDLLASGDSDAAFARRFEPGTLLEPVRMLFKDEVRTLGESLGLPPEVVSRQPFPAPALAVRCCGEVTDEKLRLLRRADAIFSEVVCEAGQERRLSQYFAVLLDTRAFTPPDGLGWVCALRAVARQAYSFTAAKLPYDLLERASERILEEVPGIGRVTYDISGGACGAIEFE